MSFSERFAINLKVQSVYGLAPFRFNKKTNEFESNWANLFQSIVTYLLISIGATVLTAMCRYGEGETNLANTENVSVFSQDAVLVVAYNGTMIKWLLLRKDHIIFLNKMNEMGEKLKVKLKIQEVTPRAAYFKWGCCTQVGIILFCKFLIANEIFKEFYFESLNWMNSFQNILFGTAVTVQILMGFYIGFLAAALGQYFDVIFCKLSHIKNAQSTLEKRMMDKVLLLGINLFNELIGLKEDFTKLFGHLMLLIFSFEFVYLTITVYFVLTYSVENIFNMTTAYLFSVFILPHVLLLVFLIHFVHKLGDVITRMCATINEFCGHTATEIKPFLNSYLLNINYMEQTKYMTVADIFTIDYSLLYKMFSAIVTYMVLLLQFRQLEQINDVKATTNVRSTWIQ